MRRAVRAASIITALSCTPAWRRQSTLLEKFKDWSAYAASGTPKVCFAVAKPKQSTPKSIKRGPIFFYISQWPADNVTNEISVKMGYPFGPGRQGHRDRRQRQVRPVHQGRGRLRREARHGVQADRGDEDRQHHEDRRQVGPRHRHERRLFARTACPTRSTAPPRNAAVSLLRQPFCPIRSACRPLASATAPDMI